MNTFRRVAGALSLAVLLATSAPAQDPCDSGWSAAPTPDQEALLHYSLLHEADKVSDFEMGAAAADCLRALKPWAADAPPSPFDESAGVERFLARAFRAYDALGRSDAATSVVREVIDHLAPEVRTRWEQWLEVY